MIHMDRAKFSHSKNKNKQIKYSYLHDKFSPPRHSPFSNESVDRLLLFLGLLNLNQPRDGVDALPVIRIGFLLQLNEILGLFTGG